MRNAKWLVASFGIISQVGWANPSDSFYVADNQNGNSQRYTVDIEPVENDVDLESQVRTALGTSRSTSTAISASAEPVAGNTCVGQERLDQFRYVDLRDLANPSNRTPIKGTSDRILTQLEENPQQFLSSLDLAPGASLGSRAVNAKFYRSGALGPQGTNTYVKGKKVFSVTNDPVHTRRNSILGVEIEKITELKCDAAFALQLILFVHDDASGYFFRRVEATFDWTAEGRNFEITGHLADISLNDTEFAAKGDLLARKVILEDKKNNITKVFPIGVGAVDLMTDISMVDFNVEVVDFDSTVQLTTYEFPNGYLEKTTTSMSHWANTRSRVFPSYYSARPFISIFDEVKGYRQIGMHYMISDSLLRGFVSHGCIRVRDQDLYQLDAIVNDGPHERITADFMKHQPDYADIEHPMKKIDDWFNVVAYKKNNSGQKGEVVECKNSKYTVRYLGDYHTVADGDCLTMIQRRNDHTSSFIDVLTKPNMPIPDIQVTTSDHIPLIEARKNGGDNGGDQGAGYYTDDGTFISPSFRRQELAHAKEQRLRAQTFYHRNRCQEYRRQPLDCRQALEDYYFFNDMVISLGGR